MKKVLVTGAAGALGRYIYRYFQKNGFEVFGTAFKSQDPTCLLLDVTSRSTVAEIIQRLKPDYVIHLSAVFDSDFNLAYPVNVLGAKNLLDSIKQTNPKARIVLIGSAAEYGLVSADDSPITINQPLRPTSIYGLTKTWQTTLGLMESMNGLNVVVARIFNLFGPGLSQKLLAGRLASQIEGCLKGDLKQISTGNLSAVRDYIHLDEAAQQIMAISLHGESGKVYHVASGVPIRIRDFVENELIENGLDPAMIVEDLAFNNKKGFDVPVIFADISKTIAILPRDPRE